MPHSGQKKIKEIGQTFCCNLKSACVKAIWDLFPQNERQVTKIHFQDMTRFKMVYYMSWLLPYLRSKTIFTLSNSFVFYWFLKCSMSHTSFSSLATCRSFCDNRSHMLLFKSKNKHIKKTFHCCRRHNLPFLPFSTIVDWYTCFMKHRCSSYHWTSAQYCKAWLKGIVWLCGVVLLGSYS